MTNANLEPKKNHPFNRRQFIKMFGMLGPSLLVAACSAAPQQIPNNSFTQEQINQIAQEAANKAVNAYVATQQALVTPPQQIQPFPQTEEVSPTAQPDAAQPTAAQSAPAVENQATQPSTNQEVMTEMPEFSINGVPAQIDHTQLVKWANEAQPAPYDVRHDNTIGLGTEMILADPGVRTVGSLAEEDQSAWSTSRQDVQKNFEQLPPSFWGTPEGGFNMFTAAAMELTFEGVNGPINIKLDARENHGWVVIIKGLSRDYNTPQDFNNQVRVDAYNPSYTMGTRFPPGQFLSQKYFQQNVDAAHLTNCGVDGCFKVSAVLVDPSGAYTIITQNDLNTPWQLVASNIR